MADTYFDPNPNAPKKKPLDPNAPPGDLAANPGAMTNDVTGDPRPISQTAPQPAELAPPTYFDPRPGTTGPAPAAPQAPPSPAAPVAPAAPPPAAAPAANDPLAAYAGRTLTMPEAAQVAQQLGMQSSNGDYFAHTNVGDAAGSGYTWSHEGPGWSLKANTPTAPTAPATDPTHGAGGPAPAAPQAPPAPAAAPAAPTDPNAAAYQQALLKMLGDSQTPASLGDAALKNQSDAYAVGQSRSLDQARSAMAERAAAEGGSGTSSGAFDQGLAGLYGQQGENQAGFNANLVGQANQQKLTQMQNALTMMGNDVNSEAGRALQGHIADMQAQIQRDQLTQQNTQFGQSQAQQLQESQAGNALQQLGITTQGNLGAGDLALRQQLGSGQLNLGLLQALMGNQQFGQNLGAQLGMFSSGQNQQALLQMLGMM